MYPTPSGNSFIALSNKIDAIVATRDYQNDALDSVISRTPELAQDEECKFNLNNGSIKFIIKKSCFQTPGIFFMIRDDGTRALISKNYHDLVSIVCFINRITDY